MEYAKVEIDFVERTLEILKQYEKWVLPNIRKQEQYEVTLLLNSLLGLIILPFEYSKRKLGYINNPTIFEGDKIMIDTLPLEWGLDKLVINEFIENGKLIKREETTLNQVITMFRHSMSHSQFGNGSKSKCKPGLSVDFTTAPYNPIKSIIFEVKFVNKHKLTVFIASIPIDSLRKFATKVAKSFLEESRNGLIAVDEMK